MTMKVSKHDLLFKTGCVSISSEYILRPGLHHSVHFFELFYKKKAPEVAKSTALSRILDQ